ncbi:LytR/AlgR family response regulator transcription factor [Microscilla marina]|uniref:Transcriptional regulator protein n=1 Tax=Microscilla marina ATCC 23134 TaxID=313606 RepID=A1ZQ18_MICM2|nr:LytTR family DNA-binding domain-containing protein [Microscilla marina]EAY27427.1 transcriptional regulator protein [Microscilla marina ATCC 23134]
MLKALIIDDEAKARRILQELLKEYCPQIEIVGEADDVPNAVKAIHKYQPNLVFLDIEMPGYTGFQLLDFFDTINFEIIFTTAYREYAIQAFQVSAIDYLLKPIQIELLIKAIEKVEGQLSEPQINERIDTLKSNLSQEYITRIALPVAEGLLFIEVDQIVYLNAEGAYTQIFLEGGKKVLVSKKIKSFEKVLDHPSFFRTHRSYLINLNRVKQYVRQDGGYIVMDNNDSVNLARERKEDFLKAYSTPR